MCVSYIEYEPFEYSYAWVVNEIKKYILNIDHFSMYNVVLFINKEKNRHRISCRLSLKRVEIDFSYNNNKFFEYMFTNKSQ